jgi:hypothetical protein
MTTTENRWDAEQLAAIGAATELEVASTRDDGSLSPYVTIWVVRAGDDLYIRSAYGPGNGWFSRAQERGTGRIRAGGVEADVTFAGADPGVHEAIDAAYHAKYDHYGPKIVGAVVGPQVRDVTLRLLPKP